MKEYFSVSQVVDTKAHLLINLQNLSWIRRMASEGKWSVYQFIILIGQVTDNKREFIYLPLQLRVRRRLEPKKSLSLGNESNIWNTQQRTPPKEKRDGMKRLMTNARGNGYHFFSR